MPFIVQQVSLLVSSVQMQTSAGTSDGDASAWQDFVNFVLHADIKFVRQDYIQKLCQQGQVWPRRQEAEEVDDALMQPNIDEEDTFKYVAVSHAWESREHPDPYGYQLATLAAYINGSGSENLVFFIDYMSLYQFKRTPDQQESFDRGMDKMHLMYTNSGEMFCAGVWSISRLTPWWWKLWTSRSSISVYSSPAEAVREVPLANLLPAVGGKCSTVCDESCANLHANHTPYVDRGWCRAEIEWSSPNIVDISYSSKSWMFSRWHDCMFALFLACMVTRWIDVLEFDWRHWCFCGAVCLFFMTSQILANGRNPLNKGWWPRSKLPLSPQEFKEHLNTHNLVFTHRVDIDPVISLQEKAYQLKWVASREMFLSSLARDDRRKLPALIAGNTSLQRLEISTTYFEEADSHRLLSALQAKQLKALLFDNCHIGSASFGRLVSGPWLQQLGGLSLQKCRIGNAAASQLAGALPAAPGLKILNLAENSIGNIGALALATGLLATPELRWLFLQENRIGNQGAYALAQALTEHVASQRAQYGPEHRVFLALTGNFVFSPDIVEEFQADLEIHAASYGCYWFFAGPERSRLLWVFFLFYIYLNIEPMVFQNGVTAGVARFMVFAMLWILATRLCRSTCACIEVYTVRCCCMSIWSIMHSVLSAFSSDAVVLYDGLESHWARVLRLLPYSGEPEDDSGYIQLDSNSGLEDGRGSG